MSRSAISVTISLSKIITLANIVIFCFILNSSTAIALSGRPTTKQEAEENSKEIIKDVTGQEHEILQHVKYDYENHPREREIAWQYYLDHKEDYTSKIKKDQLGLFLYDLTGDGKQEIVIYIKTEECLNEDCKLNTLQVDDTAEHTYQELLSKYIEYGYGFQTFNPVGETIVICQPSDQSLVFKSLCIIEKDNKPIRHLLKWFSDQGVYDLKILRQKSRLEFPKPLKGKEIKEDKLGGKHEVLHYVSCDYENYPLEREIAWQHYLDHDKKYLPGLRKDQLGIDLYGLNNDGKKEILVYTEANWCPLAGCPFENIAN